MTYRYQTLRQGKVVQGPIIYWMNRDQRVEDNWALIEALKLGQQIHQPVIVVFCLLSEYLGATDAHYQWMKRGLVRVEQQLHALSIGWIMQAGAPESVIPLLAQKLQASYIFTDFNPLRGPRQWRKKVAEQIDIPMYEVDTHNIIPCWIASDHQEYGAYTLRPKIHRLLPEYLEEFPSLPSPVSLSKELGQLIEQLNQSAQLLNGVMAMEDPRLQLKDFISNRLAHYDLRNDPTMAMTSRLSSWLHFGQLSAQRVALNVQKNGSHEAFLEELIVRRELADNFCYYNPLYDSLQGFPAWAQTTLHAHRKDPRPYLYTKDQLENGETHDLAWNAAQKEMVHTGRMHGYMRMYWAKKILEWTESPEQAMAYAIYLNDRYELDGRDPNGYTGIAWAIGGVHDRPWQERPIFGMIRYMNYAGLQKKFDVGIYIQNYAFKK